MSYRVKRDINHDEVKNEIIRRLDLYGAGGEVYDFSRAGDGMSDLMVMIPPSARPWPETTTALVIFIEIKRPGRRLDLTDAERLFRAFIKRNHGHYYLVETADEACQLINDLALMELQVDESNADMEAVRATAELILPPTGWLNDQGLYEITDIDDMFDGVRRFVDKKGQEITQETLT